MYLSRLYLNRLNRGVLRDLISPDDMHKTLWRAFPDEEAGGPGRVLFRVEPTAEDAGSRPVVLVQSERRPNWAQLPREYSLGHDLTVLHFAVSEPNEQDAVLLRRDDQFRFRLVANPTKKSEGQRHGLYREEDQRHWLARKAAESGFALLTNSLLVVPLGTLSSRERGSKARSWFGVRFEGGLRVTDPAAFAEALTNGIGPAKAFGFGLLSIARR